ncbi:MAG TPA: TfoX/Sxy family protein [Kofleriaceae bacterium]|jgi:TfoX/Sxy family transcriptional regulator of competence genes|nr:TfoX/Sxy family protein [Kofleriaceae bacterium]
MAWVKIPAEHHPVFLAALPRDRRISTIQMFGGIAARANGYMFGGLFARSAIVRLSASDQRAALTLDGAAPFDPMGNGRVMKDTIALPESVMEEPAELGDWLARAFAFITTLPPKKKAPPKATSGKTTPRSGAKAKAQASRAKPALRSGATRSGATTKPKASPENSPRRRGRRNPLAALAVASGTRQPGAHARKRSGDST